MVMLFFLCQHIVQVHVTASSLIVLPCMWPFLLNKHLPTVSIFWTFFRVNSICFKPVLHENDQLHLFLWDVYTVTLLYFSLTDNVRDIMLSL